jgi:hypothetical protein
LSKKFLILRKIRKDINVLGLGVKSLLFFLSFYETSFWTDFLKKYSRIKFHEGEASSIRGDRLVEANSRFYQFCEHA